MAAFACNSNSDPIYLLCLSPGVIVHLSWQLFLLLTDMKPALDFDYMSHGNAAGSRLESSSDTSPTTLHRAMTPSF